MKNMKITTKLISGFLILDVIIAFCIFQGYLTAGKILETENPARYIKNYLIFSLVLLAVFIAVTGIVIKSVVGAFRRSMEKMSVAAEKLAEGNIDVVMEKDGNDEFGVLMDDLNKIISGIKKDAMIAEEVAEGNLTVNVKPNSEGDVMGNALKKLVRRNHHALSNINEAAYQVMTSSSQVASASEALAQGSTEQASAIEQITVSISDIAEKTKENAGQATAAEELMVKVISDVNVENTKMQEMVVAMEEINKASESISKIIKVIDDIAFQTNILALNAAVEAARAGEAGKGFAVVAEEVRNLAAKSSQAAAETAELIEDSIRKVESGSQIADQTEKALAEVTTEIKKAENIVNGIAEASNYQATAIAQVDQAIEQVSQVVQTNSATSEECAAASVELSEQSKKMRNLIGVYKLESGKSELSAWGSDSYDDVSDMNEQVISLKDGFGKY